MTSIKVRVDEIIEETPQIRSLRLVRPDGEPLGPYPAGAHIDVTGPTGVLRQYSLCGPPDEPGSLLIAVKLEPESRGGSRALHDVRVGDLLEVSAPRNLLGLADKADSHLLIAAGIGITPLLSMAYELSGRGEAFTLHYFARSREQAAFAALLESDERFIGRVHLHTAVPREETDHLLRALAVARGSNDHVYTCGPVPFMDLVCAVFTPQVGADNVHLEHFTAAEIDTSADRPFVVELDGQDYQIPADRSILSVLEENGVDVFKSCEEGICGSCVSGVLEGVPEHRDNCLSTADKAAGTQMALCVSRAASPRLVIELY